MNAFLVVLAVVAVLVQACHGNVLFSTLQKTLVVTASPQSNQVLKAGQDNLTVTWVLNTTAAGAGADSSYKTVKVKLCYAPISQVDRGWRKTKDDLKKDKTCSFLIVAKPYSNSGNTTITVKKDVPQATYFIRVYAINAEGIEVAYGQTTNAAKNTNLFEVKAITGRHTSLDIASICFSAFSILSLVGFFVAEKSRAKNK